MHVMRSLFSIVAVLALLIFLFISVEADFGKGESCQCFFIGDCQFDDWGVGYKYYLCRGACAGYSHWQVDNRCRIPKINIS